MFGSKIIGRAMGMMTKGELVRATVTWRQAHFGADMSGLLQLPCITSKEDGEVGKEVTPSPSSNPAASRRFSLDDIWGLVHTTQTPPFGTVSIHSHTGVQDTACGSMCLPNLHKAPNCLHLWFQLLPMGSYTWGPLEYQSVSETLSAHSIEVPAKAIFGQVAPTNQVPSVVLIEASGGSTMAQRKDGSWKHWISRA